MFSSNAWRLVGAFLLLVVFFFSASSDNLPEPVSPVIDIDGFSAALVLTDRGTSSSVAATPWRDPEVLALLDDLGYQWRSWDDSVDPEAMKNVPEGWKIAYRKAISDSRGSRPWLLIGNASGGISLQLPDDVEEVKSLIEKYGASR